MKNKTVRAKAISRNVFSIHLSTMERITSHHRCLARRPESRKSVFYCSSTHRAWVENIENRAGVQFPAPHHCLLFPSYFFKMVCVLNR